MISTFPERLRELRKQSNASQQELSNLLGISTRGYRFYESGDREPNIDGILALADYFNVSTDYLLGRTDEK